MPQVNTVLGPIDGAAMGGTMSHVHLTANILCWHMPPEDAARRALSESKLTLENVGVARRNALLIKDNLVHDDVALTIRETRDYRVAGGGTLINVDLPGLGRDVSKLKEIATDTGLHIVASTGWYVQASHPAEIAEMGIEALADAMVREIEIGIGDTGVKAGNIGEIGLSGYPHEAFQPGEEKVLRAAARAQKATGLSMTIHPNAPLAIHGETQPNHFDTYIKILEKEGADLSRVYMSHLGLYEDVDVAIRILRAGVGFVSYDHFGHEELVEDLLGPGRGFSPDKQEVRSVYELLDAGYADRVLIGSEVGFKTCYKRYGGWGYSHVYDNIIPWLTAIGASAEDLRKIMVDNPRRLHAV
ncbi:MAG: hypothetical protein KC466_05575 [Myxococcales bacterium]|nr:hypothetical protein [Myxococcales bacterium]